MRVSANRIVLECTNVECAGCAATAEQVQIRRRTYTGAHAAAVQPRQQSRVHRTSVWRHEQEGGHVV